MTRVDREKRHRKCMSPRAVISKDLSQAIRILLSGGVVGMPTETVYGLAADALNAAACRRIFEVKQRPSDNPLIVHISGLEMLGRVIEPMLYKDFMKEPSEKDDELVRRLRKAFKLWPAPLTLILPKHPSVPDVVCGAGGLDTVAVRMPRHILALELIRVCDTPLAAPSANLSGRPSPTTAQHVIEDLGDRIELVLDGGSCEFGLESTVLDLTAPHPTILRPGSITLKHLREVFPDCQMYKVGEDSSLEAKPPTPGLKYRHYSPHTPVVLCHDRETANKFLSVNMDKNIVTLVYGPAGDSREISVAKDEKDFVGMAQNLFAVLRHADSMGVDYILALTCEEVDEGVAVMNRLSKAAHIRI